jgi:hypothetical protein
MRIGYQSGDRPHLDPRGEAVVVPIGYNRYMSSRPPDEQQLKKLRIGPAGWSYEDWKGIVYPSGAGRRFDPLSYLAGFFDVVEINSSFRRRPSGPARGSAGSRRTRVSASPPSCGGASPTSGKSHPPSMMSRRSVRAWTCWPRRIGCWRS